MTNQKTNPKVEWGFYAITPRIVRTQYKDCSHAEKWLYTCLKDLCGDKGTCFRSLRALSEETGISIASLSTMIPHLHAVGLIHAEKKSRGRGGKEVWHISIVDIWQANKEHCSKNEQVSDGDVQDLNNNVQNLNEVPESCSKNERSCSNFSDRRITPKNNITEERTIEDESIPAHIDTPVSPPDVGALTLSPQSNTQSQQGDAHGIIDNRTTDDHHSPVGHHHGVASRDILQAQVTQGDDNALPPGTPDGSPALPSAGMGGIVSTAQDRPVAAPTTRPVLEAGEEVAVSKQNTPTPTPAQASPPTSEQAVLGAKGKGKKQAEVKPEFTPEGETLYQDWCSLFHVKIPRTKAIILAANDLYEPIAYWSGKLDIPRAEVLKRIMNWQYKNNPNYYGEGRGVKLFDVQRDIEGWISAAERKLARDALKVVPVREDRSAQFNMGPIVLESHRKGGLRGKALAPAH